jgi:hypothetical protein
MKSDRSAEFVRNMTTAAEPESVAAPKITARPIGARKKAPEQRPAGPTSRAGLKHIGGYVDDETVEKVALLRARLKLDNSELIKLAVNDLYVKQRAKRAFGDA